MIESYKEALYHVKRRFFIIGLTGYTGAGCSTCKDILSSQPQPEIPPYESIAYNFDHTEDSILKSTERGHKKGTSDRDKRIYDKLKRAWESKEVEWEQFITIEISTIIFSFAIYRATIDRKEDKHLDIIREMIKEESERFNHLNLLWKKEKIINHKEHKTIIELYLESNQLYKHFKSICIDKKIDYVT